MAGMVLVALLHAGALVFFVPHIPVSCWIADASKTVRDSPSVVLFGVMLYAGFGFALDRLVPSGLARYLVVASAAVVGMLVIVMSALTPLYRMGFPG